MEKTPTLDDFAVLIRPMVERARLNHEAKEAELRERHPDLAKLIDRTQRWVADNIGPMD